MRVPSGVPASDLGTGDAAVDADSRCQSCAARACAQRQMRDRRNRRQRLAAKARASRSPPRSSDSPDLAGRVTLERQPRILRRHALAIVLDANEPLAAELRGDGDAPGAGVEAVLDQLLDDRGGPLDHLAGSDLVGQRQPAGWRMRDMTTAQRDFRNIHSMTHRRQRHAGHDRCQNEPRLSGAADARQVHVHAEDAGDEGQRHEDDGDNRQHLHHFVQPVRHVRQVRFENARDAILEDERLVCDAHEVVVDVTEAVCQFVADHRELAARQPADRVPLRRRDAAQARDVALHVENLANRCPSTAPGIPAPPAGRATAPAPRLRAGSCRPSGR